MIWALLFLAVIPVLLLIFAGGTEDESEADPVAHYKRQLAELEDDLKSRLLTKDAVANARLEIERRILRLADYQENKETGKRSSFAMPAAVCSVLIAGSIFIYNQVGSPGVQSQPGQAASLLQAPITDDGPSYGETIDQLQAHLANNPDDQNQWKLLGEVANTARSFSVAANAYGVLVRLDPEDNNWRVRQLEAYIMMANGQITPAANMLVQALLAVEPEHPAGHYYLGLARLQLGDRDAAKAIWTALADRSPVDAPWMPTVQQRLAEVGVAPPTLTKDQIDSVAEMSAEQQDAFVRSMIARLAERLESAPDDIEGWVMLARSQAALGEQNAAIATLTRALDLVEPDKRPQLQAFLDNLTKDLNL